MIKQETKLKYRKALIEIYSSLKRGESIHATNFCTQRGITSSFMSHLTEMNVIIPNGRKHNYKWIEKITGDESEKTQYFLTLADRIGEKISDVNQRILRNKNTKDNQLKKQVELEVQNRFNELQKSAMSEPIVQTTPQKQSNEFDFYMGMNNSEGFLLIEILRENDNPALQRFTKMMAARIFEHAF